MTLSDPSQMPLDVADAFAAIPYAPRKILSELRRLILQTAEAHPAVGSIQETLKWGQPSYLTVKPKSGTTIRLGVHAGDPALFCHCQTTLIGGFRTLYPDAYAYDGNRAMILQNGISDRDALTHCITQALTYHCK